MSCKKCGGTMQGDGYKTVMACEYADEADVEIAEPDADPIYCNFSDDSKQEIEH